MPTITKRGDRQWQAKIRKRGYATESKTFQTKARAERWARSVESEMDRGIFLSTSTAEETSLEELLKRYEAEVLPTKKSHADVRSRIKVITELIGFHTVAALSPRILAAYRDERLTKIQGHTVRKELYLIGRVLKHAQREWEIYLPRGNPIDSVAIPTQPKGRDRRLQAGEEEKLLDAARAYGGTIGDVITLAIETGMRRGEISELRWRDIDLRKRTAALRDTKNGDDRMIPLSTTAVRLLRTLPRDMGGRVFSMRPDSIIQAFERVCQRAGLDDLRFHDLRHEATSRFFELGLTIMEVSSITGHRDLGMLKRYTHLRAEDLAKKLRGPARRAVDARPTPKL